MTHLFFCTSPAFSGWQKIIPNPQALPASQRGINVHLVSIPKGERKMNLQQVPPTCTPAILHACAASCAISAPVWIIYLPLSSLRRGEGSRNQGAKTWTSDFGNRRFDSPTADWKAAVRVCPYNRSSPVHSLQKCSWKASLFDLLQRSVALLFSKSRDQPLSCNTGKTHLTSSILNLLDP